MGDPNGWDHLVCLLDDEITPEPDEETNRHGDEVDDLLNVGRGGPEAKRAEDNASAHVNKNSKTLGFVVPFK